MLEPKTIGIIGSGNIVFTAHLPLLKAIGTEPKWILDISKKNADTAAKAFSIPLALSPDELDKTTPTDLVMLACPYGTRKPYYEFLKDKPAALYIEKPVAKSLRELREINSLRDDYAICSGLLRRRMGIVQIVKGLIEDRVFGALRSVRSNFGTATQTSSGASFAKNLALAGGGQLFESAIHNIDAICYMANIERANVVRKEMEHENGFDLHTQALIELQDRDGHVVEMELLVTCFHSAGYHICMKFDHATLTFSLFDYAVPVLRAGKSGRAYKIVDALLEDYPRNQYDVMYAFWKDFHVALKTRTANYTNLCDAVATTEIIEQLYSPVLQGAE